MSALPTAQLVYGSSFALVQFFFSRTVVDAPHSEKGIKHFTLHLFDFLVHFGRKEAGNFSLTTTVDGVQKDECI